MMRSICTSTMLAAALLSSLACHPGAVINTGSNPSVGGTIAGLVRSGANPVIGRRVTVVNTSTGARFEATTGANGGYTIKVPEGTYRIDLETGAGETIGKRPDPTQVNNSDLDAARDFEVTGPSPHN
jgi:Carboxypeptidase regulatory-like domain